jgi:hypothetical protein
LHIWSFKPKPVFPKGIQYPYETDSCFIGYNNLSNNQFHNIKAVAGSVYSTVAYKDKESSLSGSYVYVNGDGIGNTAEHQYMSIFKRNRTTIKHYRVTQFNVNINSTTYDISSLKQGVYIQEAGNNTHAAKHIVLVKE